MRVLQIVSETSNTMADSSETRSLSSKLMPAKLAGNGAPMDVDTKPDALKEAQALQTNMLFEATVDKWKKLVRAKDPHFFTQGALKIGSDEKGWTVPYSRQAAIHALNQRGKFQTAVALRALKLKKVPFDLSIDWESAKGLAGFQYTKPNEDDDNEIETVVMVRALDNVEDLEPNLTNESLEIVNEAALIHCWAFVLATSDRWNEKANLAARSVVVRFIKAQSIRDELNWIRENCIAAEALVGNKIYTEANALQIMEKVEVVCQTIDEKKNRHSCR